jgi:hypothetical protein
MRKILFLLFLGVFLGTGGVVLAETCSPTEVSLEKESTGGVFLDIGKDDKPTMLYTDGSRSVESPTESKYLKCTNNDCSSFEEVAFDSIFNSWNGGMGVFADGSVAFVMVGAGGIGTDMYFVKCSDNKCSDYTKTLFKKDFVKDSTHDIYANAPYRVVVDKNDLPNFYFKQSFTSGTRGDPYVDLYLVRCSKKDCSEYKVNKVDKILSEPHDYFLSQNSVIDKDNKPVIFYRIYEYETGHSQIILNYDGTKTIVEEATNSCYNGFELNSLSMYLGNDGNPVLNYIKRVGSADSCTNKYITVFCANKTCTEKKVIDTVKGSKMKKGRDGYPVYEYRDGENQGIIVCQNADCSEKTQRPVLTGCNPDNSVNCPVFADFELDNEYKPVWLVRRTVFDINWKRPLYIYRCCTVDCGTTFEPLNWYGTCKNVVDETRGCTKCESDSYQGMNRWGGDYNCSGDLTAGDYIIWRDEFFKKGTEREADGDCDGKTSLSDYSKWREEYLK